MTLSLEAIQDFRSRVDECSDPGTFSREELLALADTAIHLFDAVVKRNRALLDGRPLGSAKVAASIEKTKLLFLRKAREHESGDLAEEWIKALRVLCEAESGGKFETDMRGSAR